MKAERSGIWTMWHDGTFSQIERTFAGVPVGDERQRGIEAISKRVRTTPPGVEDAARAAVDLAVQNGLITQEEADHILAP